MASDRTRASRRSRGSRPRTDLELQFHPRLRRVSMVRRFVEGFYEGLIDDLDLVSRVAMATHELLENVAKYSLDGYGKLSIRIEAGNIIVSVSNRASPEYVESLVEIFETMARVGTPSDVYQAAMARSATRSDGSGLGLARICAEGEMTLTLTRRHDRVLLQATAPLELGDAQ